MLDELAHFGITTVGSVENLIEKHLVDVLERDKERVKEIKKAVSSGDKSHFENKITSPERLAKKFFYKYTGFLRAILKIEFGEKEVNQIIMISIE